MEQVLAQIVGPLGALVLAVTALGILAREHRRSDDRRDAEHAAALAYSRSRAEAADARLDAFRETMKEANNVTERAVALAEAASRRRGAN